MKMIVKNKVIKNLPDGELNPGLPRDRRGYSPLYYRGLHDYLFVITNHMCNGLAFVLSFVVTKISK